MTIITCPACGVLLDKDTVKYTNPVKDDYGEWDMDTAVWEEGSISPFTRCPVCGWKIPKEEE